MTIKQEITILGASAPTWASEDKTSINLMVRLSPMPDQAMPFTATPDDPAEHGRELFTRAKFGEYGEIGPYAGPSKAEEQARVFEIKRAAEQAKVEKRITLLERVKRLGLADNDELAELEALELYSVQLMRAEGPELPARV